MWPALAAPARAGDEVAASLHGDVKSFFVATFPYEHPLMPDDPTASGALDGRLKLQATWRGLSFEAHETVTAQTGGTTTGIGTGVGGSAPEALRLTFTPVDADALRIRVRTDRLVVRVSTPGVAVVVGRQPVTFGHALFFAPLDLVNPFFPTTIDQEYKPGVDAARVDAYVGSAAFTVVGAYAGGALADDAAVAEDWSLATLALAAYGQATVGVTDLGGFVGLIRGDTVLGATTVSAVGPVGIQADAAFTLPADEGEDPFFRGSAGALWRPFTDTTVTAEGYVQTLGSGDPGGYLAALGGERYARGELWLVGRYYLGLAVSHQIVPTLSATASGFVNLEDPSALVALALAWSVSDEASVGAGAFVGLGARPEGLAATSEFGLYPAAAYARVSTYF